MFGDVQTDLDLWKLSGSKKTTKVPN